MLLDATSAGLRCFIVFQCDAYTVAALSTSPCRRELLHDEHAESIVTVSRSIHPDGSATGASGVREGGCASGESGCEVCQERQVDQVGQVRLCVHCPS